MTAAANRAGWVPFSLKFLPGEVCVDWCWLGKERFTAPFFDQTVAAALGRPFNALFVHRTPIAELCAWHAASPGLRPSGFIFHMSRCGSTLVSSMFAALPDTVVVSEAGPVDRLARATFVPEEIRAGWLRAMIGALGQRRSGSETRYFIKFDSMTALALAFIRRVFPEVPWVFVYRNPEEVLVSQLANPAPSMAPGFVTDVSPVAGSISELLAMPPEEYAARVIGCLCECAAEALATPGSPGIAVDYDELPAAVPERIASHFQTTLSPEHGELVRAAALRHAKRPEMEFTPDGEAKRSEASEAMRSASRRWIAAPLAKLRQNNEFALETLGFPPPVR